MNNDDIIKTLMQLEYPYPDNEEQYKINEAINKAIEVLRNETSHGERIVYDYDKLRELI